jgi:hypothetical protein
MARLLGIGAWTMAALFCAACGTTVETSPSGATSGTGGTTGTVGTGPGTGTGGGESCGSDLGCCPGGVSGDCCVMCGTGTGGFGGAGGTGGGGGSAFCGGIAGILCAADQFCDFPDDQCGGNDNTGVCVQRPIGCPDIYQPTCGCDNKVYGNACDANSQGVDVNVGEGCAPPGGMFPCGAGFCALGMQYCERDTSDVGNQPSSFSCHPLPATCGSTPSCACLSGVPCGGICMGSQNGAFEVTCPGG